MWPIWFSRVNKQHQFHIHDDVMTWKSFLHYWPFVRDFLHNRPVMWNLDCWFVVSFNTLRPRQNGRNFADDTFKCIFLNETFRISIKISLKFVPKGPINNIPALVQKMAWCQSGDKLLSESMMVRLLTHICVTRPQWVNKLLNKWNGYHIHIFVDHKSTALFSSIFHILWAN